MKFTLENFDNEIDELLSLILLKYGEHIFECDTANDVFNYQQVLLYKEMFYHLEPSAKDVVIDKCNKLWIQLKDPNLDIDGTIYKPGALLKNNKKESDDSVPTIDITMRRVDIPSKTLKLNSIYELPHMSSPDDPDAFFYDYKENKMKENTFKDYLKLVIIATKVSLFLTFMAVLIFSADYLLNQEYIITKLTGIFLLSFSIVIAIITVAKMFMHYGVIDTKDGNNDK